MRGSKTIWRGWQVATLYTHSIKNVCLIVGVTTAYNISYYIDTPAQPYTIHTLSHQSFLCITTSSSPTNRFTWLCQMDTTSRTRTRILLRLGGEATRGYVGLWQLDLFQRAITRCSYECLHRCLSWSQWSQFSVGSEICRYTDDGRYADSDIHLLHEEIANILFRCRCLYSFHSSHTPSPPLSPIRCIHSYHPSHTPSPPFPSLVLDAFILTLLLIHPPLPSLALDVLFRGIIEDYYFKGSNRHQMWNNTESRIFAVASEHNVTIRTTSMCEMPLIPLRNAW